MTECCRTSPIGIQLLDEYMQNAPRWQRRDVDASCTYRTACSSTLMLALAVPSAENYYRLSFLPSYRRLIRRRTYHHKMVLLAAFVSSGGLDIQIIKLCPVVKIAVRSSRWKAKYLSATPNITGARHSYCRENYQNSIVWVSWLVQTNARYRNVLLDDASNLTFAIFENVSAAEPSSAFLLKLNGHRGFDRISSEYRVMLGWWVWIVSLEVD